MCLSVTEVPGVHGDERSLGLEWRLRADVGAGNWTVLPVQEDALLTAGPSFQPWIPNDGSWVTQLRLSMSDRAGSQTRLPDSDGTKTSKPPPPPPFLFFSFETGFVCVDQADFKLKEIHLPLCLPSVGINGVSHNRNVYLAFPQC